MDPARSSAETGRHARDHRVSLSRSPAFLRHECSCYNDLFGVFPDGSHYEANIFFCAEGPFCATQSNSQAPRGATVEDLAWRHLGGATLAGSEAL